MMMYPNGYGKMAKMSSKEMKMKGKYADIGL